MTSWLTAFLAAIFVSLLFGATLPYILKRKEDLPESIEYNRLLYFTSTVAVVFSPALSFIAALRLNLLPPDAYGLLFLGLFGLVSLPTIILLARLEGRERAEAFLLKMERDSRLGRKVIALTWLGGSLLVMLYGLHEILA